MNSIKWQNLVPSELAGMKRLVTSSNGAQGARNYVAAAGAPDGSLLVAYVPPNGERGAQSLTIDMTAMRGDSRARWWNPASGAYALIAQSLPDSSAHDFTTPGNNGTGANDWLLVLDRP